MEIVEFENGKFAVRTGNFFSGYEYLDRSPNYSWSRKEHIKLYCLFDTKEEAEKRAMLGSLTIKNRWKVV